MVSNVYTKNEILEGLASKGHFIDNYTLDSFFEKWEIEAIYEDEEGQEFFDKSTLDFVCEKLFSDKDSSENNENASLSEETEDTAIQSESEDTQQQEEQTEEQPQEQQQQEEEQPQEEISFDENSDEISINNEEEISLETEEETHDIQKPEQDLSQSFSDLGLINIRDIKTQKNSVKEENSQEDKKTELNVNEDRFDIPEAQKNGYMGQFSNNTSNISDFNQQTQGFGQKPQTPQQFYGQTIQPQIQPQIMPQQNPQFQNNLNANQMPYGAQQQYQMPYQNSQIQQPINQYNQFQNNSFQNQQMQRENIQQNGRNQNSYSPKPNLANEFSVNDPEVSKILNGVRLSNGSSLMNKLKSETGLKDYSQQNNVNSNSFDSLSNEEILKPLPSEKKPAKKGLLEGAMAAAGMSEEDLIQKSNDNMDFQNDETPDFDDISLLSESMEAQEKFRQYVVSELSKKNVDLTPQGNEFKLDISERTINMIARTVAKKIAKNVTAILTNETKNNAQGPLKQENEKLIKIAKELEEENKKLRLLLTESNKNLSSYKPTLFSIFGIYRKVKVKSRPNHKIGLNAQKSKPMGSKPKPKK